ncbi:MAG: GNAT family N-acetyltransferase [Proteobacteria bacterium]|nr:GNAT family N-acetyltransferase [Pseudomonadota bacterium]
MAETMALRPLAAADLAAAAMLTGSFRWPHRLADWEFMFALGEGVGLDQDGKLVATGMLWRYGADRAALGLVAVASEMQGRGIGRAVMERLLAMAGGRSVTLYATRDGEPLYRSLGFAVIGEARQMQGNVTPSALQALPEGDRLRPSGRSDPAVLHALDRAASGLDRAPLIDALLGAGTTVVLDRNGAPAGFAVQRRFGRGQVIGPVVAPDADGAKALIGHFLNTGPGQFVRIDVTAESGLVDWLAGLGLTDAGEAIHMARGAPPDCPGPARRFALASQAFG